MFSLVLVVVCARATLAQPTTACQEASNCPAGFYCETYSHFCRECLRCEDLMRLPSPRTTSCVKSVVDCGLCYDGLVEDIHGDLNSPCVAATGDASERDGGISPLVWLAVALGGLFLVAVVAIVIYVLRNTDAFKVQALSPEPPPPYRPGALTAPAHLQHEEATRPSVQPPPELPPPYRLAAPTASAPTAPAHLHHEEESSWPFIKLSSPYNLEAGAGGEATGGAAAREQAAAQAARVYCNPAYVRTPLIPNSYEVESEHEEFDEPFSVHDEDTMESVWMPHDAGAAPPTSAAASAAGVVATSPDSELEPPAKRQCVPQDSNNNKDPGEGAAPPLEASSSAARRHSSSSTSSKTYTWCSNATTSNYELTQTLPKQLSL